MVTSLSSSGKTVGENHGAQNPYLEKWIFHYDYDCDYDYHKRGYKDVIYPFQKYLFTILGKIL